MNVTVVRPQKPFDRMPEDESPNPDIDKALKELMDDIGDRKKVPYDVAVKIINSAIAWEKVKNHIADKDEEFDPDNPGR